jgi:hypothetical protein
MIYDPQPYEEPPLPVSPEDEAYSELSDENVRLRALIKRAADVLCAYASSESAFVQELRRAAK